MKKILLSFCIVILIASVLSSAIPASAEENLYEYALFGDLLYTVNFNGDSYYSPASTSGSLTVTPDSQDSTKAVIQANTNNAQNRWGGEITGLPLGINNAYTITWTETRNDNVDGAIGIYADNVYGSYGYLVKHKLMYNGSNIGSHDYITYTNKSILAAATACDGTPQSFAMEVNAQDKTIKLYISDYNNVWQLLDQSTAGEIMSFATSNLGIYLYVYYSGKPITLSAVNIYKGLTISGEILQELEETTAPDTTTPPDTTAKVTTATPQTTKKVETTKTPETTTAAGTTVITESKTGCGKSSILIGFAQSITIIGGSILFIAIKKKF